MITSFSKSTPRDPQSITHGHFPQAPWPSSLAQTVPTLIAPQGLCIGSFFCHITLAFAYLDGLLCYFCSVIKCHLIKQGFVASLYKMKTHSSLPYPIFHTTPYGHLTKILLFTMSSSTSVCVPWEYFVYYSVPTVWHRVGTE